MKKIIITILMFGQTILFAQTTKKENIAFTTAEFRGGYGVTNFGKGLKERYNAGNFSTSSGGLASLAAYRKFKNVNYFNFGIKFKSLGAGPSKGNNNEEMFFNYWGAAITTKFFLMDKEARKGIYLQADYFFITQFTQKYRKVSSLIYDHQFAIGSGLALGIGNDFKIGKGKTMFTIGLEYETDSRTGETSTIGNKNFRSSNFGIMTGFKF